MLVFFFLKRNLIVEGQKKKQKESNFQTFVQQGRHYYHLRKDEQLAACLSVRAFFYLPNFYLPFSLKILVSGEVTGNPRNIRIPYHPEVFIC
jgi:hypothetical protein